MRLSGVANQPIQLRHDDSDEDYEVAYAANEQSVERGGLEDDLDSNDSNTSEDEEADHDLDSEDEGSPSASDTEPEALDKISFGALAKAQEALAPPSKSRKRKLETLETSLSQQPAPVSIDAPHPTRDVLSKKSKQDPITSRTSKHAPTILSSRNPVSRRRTDIFSPPPAQKSRDPRFDPTITSQTLNANSIAATSKAYSFLSDYQATEILDLKSQIKKAEKGAHNNKNNPDLAASLKKKLMSMESRLRNAATQTREQEILRRHKAQEKQAIKEGRKQRPYFLKKSDVRKEIDRERVEGMGKKQRDKMEKRKRMREKKKEARDMPWARRGP